MQLATTPRFRTDLVAECIETDGQRFIDVIDPDTDTAFRFYEVEYSLACAMDGERDVEGLVQWAKEELGIEPSPDELQNVINTLGGLGYLDAAAANAAADDEVGLARGVVAARPEALPSAGDVELGRVAHDAPVAREAMPAAADLELGTPGGHATAELGGPPADDLELGAPGAAEPVATLRRGKTRPDIDDDGPTNLPPADVGTFDDDEVSVDLSQHLDLGRDDVKEAVRMSRSMQAVSVPQDLLDQLGDREAEIAARAQAAKDEAVEQRLRMDTPAPGVEVKPPVAPVAEVKPPEPVKPVVRPEPKPKEPEKRPAADQNARPVAVAAPSSGVSTFLVVLLVLALLGAGAFFVYKYVLNKKDAEETTEVSQGSASGKKKGTAKGTAKASGSQVASGKGTGTDVGTGKASGTDVDVPVKAAPTTKLEAVAGTPVDIDGGDGGVVAWVVDDGATVAVDDPVIQYKGVEYFKGKLGNSRAGLIREIEVSVPGEIDKATKQRDKAAASGNTAEVKRLDKYIAERTKRLGQKQDDAKKLQDKIDGFTIKATAAGVVHPKTAVGKRVAKQTVVAQLDGASVLTGTFSMPAGEFKTDDSIRIAPKGAPDKSVTCLVTNATADTVAFSCTSDLGLSAGQDVELAP